MDYQELFDLLIGWGFGIEQARSLALTLSQYSFQDMSQEQFGQYMLPILAQAETEKPAWAKYERDLENYRQEVANQKAYSERWNKQAMYGAYYNPKTQRSWEYEQAERERAYEQLRREQAGQAPLRVTLDMATGRQYPTPTLEERWYAEDVPRILRETPTYEQVTAPILEGLRGLSPNLQRYFERIMPDIYQEANMPDLRRQWLEEKTKYRRQPKGAEGEWWTLSEAELAEQEAPHTVWEAESEAARKLVDPWQKFLTQYPFLEKFRGLTPREKGFYPSQFRAPTRFLG